MNMKYLLPLLLLILVAIPALAETYTTQGPFPQVQLLTQSPNPARPGQIVEVDLGIQNLGSTTLTDFEIELLDSHPFSVLQSQDNLKTYGSIPGKYNGEQTIIARWNVKVAENAIEGNNDLKVRYRWGNRESWVYQDIDVLVRTGDVALTISSITTQPEQVAPGQPFQLNILVENPAGNPLHDLKFNLKLTAPLVTISSTNEKYVQQINADSSHTVTFDMITRGDADDTVYSIPMVVDWKDVEGNDYQKNLTFGLIVGGTPDLIANIEESEVISRGDKGEVSISISNLGVEEVKFVTIYLEDTEDYQVISSKQVYLGNIDSDDFENVNYDIYVRKGKDSIPLKGTMVFQDTLNNQFTKNLSLALPLYSRSEAASLGLVQGGNPVVTYIGFVILVFIVAFWIMMFTDLRKTKMPKNKKLVWMTFLILTTIFGAILYYFMVKRARND